MIFLPSGSRCGVWVTLVPSLRRVLSGDQCRRGHGMALLAATPRAGAGWLLLLQKPLQLAQGLAGMLVQPRAGTWPPGMVLRSKEGVCQHPSCSKMLSPPFVCWICHYRTAHILNAAGSCPVPEKHWEPSPTLGITQLLLHIPVRSSHQSQGKPRALRCPLEWQGPQHGCCGLCG